MPKVEAIPEKSLPIQASPKKETISQVTALPEKPLPVQTAPKKETTSQVTALPEKPLPVQAAPKMETISQVTALPEKPLPVQVAPKKEAISQVTALPEKPLPAQAAPKQETISQVTVHPEKPLPVVATKKKTFSQVATPPVVSKKSFTVQLIAGTEKRSLMTWSHSKNLQKPVRIFKLQRFGKDWYVLTAGQFNTPQEARTFINKLPASSQASGPWVRAMSTLP
jgi:septal ring-binding cell division protein DamX